MQEWEHYPPSTWTAQAGDMLALVKELTPSDFVFVVGTLHEARCSGKRSSEQNAKAACIRYMWTVKNLTPEQTMNVVAHM